MRGIGCFLPLKEKKTFFSQEISFFGEYKQLKNQHDSNTFSMDVTWAQNF